MDIFKRIKLFRRKPKKKKVYFIHPDDFGKWIFPDDVVVRISPYVTPGKYFEMSIPHLKKVNRGTWFGRFLRAIPATVVKLIKLKKDDKEGKE